VSTGTKITEIIGGDIEQRSVDAVGNRLDRTGGWCDLHNNFAWRYKDGSIGCFHMAVIRWPDDGRCVNHWRPLSVLLGDRS
jgi:hypothetical protein